MQVCLFFPTVVLDVTEATQHCMRESVRILLTIKPREGDCCDQFRFIGQGILLRCKA